MHYQHVIATWHRAFETRNFELLPSLFDEHVTLFSPAVFKAKKDRSEVICILRIVFDVLADYRVVNTFQSNNRLIFEFEASIGSREIEGIDSIELGPNGLVKELKVYVRPLSGLTALATEVSKQLAKGPGLLTRILGFFRRQ